jgi:hypothetical protein
MPKFYYTQEVRYVLTVEAATAEEADAIAFDTDVTAEGVVGDYPGWEEDGVAE